MLHTSFAQATNRVIAYNPSQLRQYKHAFESAFKLSLLTIKMGLILLFLSWVLVFHYFLLHR